MNPVATPTQAPRKLIARGFGVNLMPARTSPGVVLAISKDGVVAEVAPAPAAAPRQTIDPETNSRKYAALYDDLVMQWSTSVSAWERQRLQKAIDDVKSAWWVSKCDGADGSATLRAVSVDASQLHTGA